MCPTMQITGTVPIRIFFFQTKVLLFTAFLLFSTGWVQLKYIYVFVVFCIAKLENHFIAIRYRISITGTLLVSCYNILRVKISFSVEALTVLVEEGFVSAGNKLEYLEQLAAFPLLNQVSGQSNTIGER